MSELPTPSSETRSVGELAIVLRNAALTKVKEGQVLTPSEVGAIFRVDRKTVVRWIERGLIKSFKTLGGHHRFEAKVVAAAIKDAVLAGGEKP